MCYDIGMMKARRRKLKKAGTPAKLDSVMRRYREIIAAERVGPDDLPHVKLAPPAVKPKGVTAEQIRRAVRRAVEEYVERHSKTLARS